ncbi:galactokinase [Kallotenue papyrolyticum]|uniref:galactokinase n=1 Tax=Kallotenue papyrolyticum TaxID=1325125 RepID=UPI0004786216|nr:galactokinase [Kallotenue papyrolyticum]
MAHTAADRRRIAMIRQFCARFDAPPTHLSRAPGRVNLIGEHTDYNDGFVLPAAIDRAAYVLARARPDRRLRLYAVQYAAEATLDLDRLRPDVVQGWAAYVAGMADELSRADFAIGGADLLIDGDVPQGAGLSSSAALEVAVGAALLALSGHPPDPVALARAGQQTEHRYIHVRSGIMDQLIAALGRRHHALLIDCRDYRSEPIPLRPDVAIVVCNSKVRRELAHSGYNTRRAECDEAVRLLRERLPHIRALRDVDMAHLEANAERLPPPILKRARHVVSENERVLQSAEALKRGDIQRFGALMNEAHRSYRDDFEASTPEIEVLVSTAQGLPGVYGSRLTGGGWGGCTVSLVATDQVEQVCSRIAATYEREVGYAPEIYVCAASDGVTVQPLDADQQHS